MSCAKKHRDRGEIFRLVFDALTCRSGKSRWLEKTPSHVFHIDEIVRAVPDALFVEIVRDPRDVLASKKTRQETVWERYDPEQRSAKFYEKSYDPFWDTDSLILLLLTGSVVVSILNGGAYDHYWIQLFPFAAIFISYALSSRNALGVRLVANTLAALAVVAALTAFAPNSIKVMREWPRFEDRHVIRQMADAIAADRRESDEVYAFTGHLVHWYLGQNPPSRIVHPSNLGNKTVLRLLVEGGYIEPDEFGRILESRPRYILKRPGKLWYLDKGQNLSLAKVLSEDYELWKSSGKVAVYRRR